MMTIATKTIHGAEAIEHAIKKAAPDGFPLSGPDHILSLAATVAIQAVWSDVAFNLAVLLAATSNESGDKRFMEALFNVAGRVSDWHIGEALNADKRNAIRVISSAVEKLPSAGKRIAREIEKELSEP